MLHVLFHVDIKLGRPLFRDIVKLLLFFKTLLIHKLSAGDIFDVLIL